MNTALWIAQGFLALVFGASAVVKGTWDRGRLVRAGLTGVQEMSVPTIRFIALCEALGTLGLLLPWWSGVASALTPAAAIGLAAIMVLAAGIHARLGETRNVATNIFLLALCAFVAWGRGSLAA